MMGTGIGADICKFCGRGFPHMLVTAYVPGASKAGDPRETIMAVERHQRACPNNPENAGKQQAPQRRALRLSDLR